MLTVSQTQASEEIREAGLDVVGWYHSHPTFAPNPSIRDIETQLKFQVIGENTTRKGILVIVLIHSYTQRFWKWVEKLARQKFLT